MVKAKSHQSVDWSGYFQSIRAECPWSLRAWEQGRIDIVEWEDRVIPLAPYLARVYVIDDSEDVIEALCKGLDYGQDQWLFSYPGYGEFAAPVKILIQQDRSTLTNLRSRLGLE